MGAQRNSPKTIVASPVGKSTTLQFLFNLDSKVCSSQKDDNKTESLDSEGEELKLIITYCTQLRSDDQESALKRLKLTQILSIIKTSITMISDEALDSLFKMVACNIFRPLPLPSITVCSIVSPEDDDAIATPSAAWPYLQIVYDILLRLITKKDVKTLCREHIDGSKTSNQGTPIDEQLISRNFILNLLTLFNSDDPRERDAVKNIVHRIYSKFTFYRSFMRKAMTEFFLYFIYETDHRQNGIGELLEIWGSIINGFTVPLKDEHKVFLSRVLIPLHKPKNMAVYHRQLGYCVSQFVQKEPELGPVVIRKILRYWPVTNCQKEVLLIGELEEIVEYLDRRQYLKIAFPLWTQITKCIKSNNSQVAERALYVWNNEQFTRVVSQDIEMVFPILVEAIEKNIMLHWCKSVQQLTLNVKVLLEELEPVLYKTCLEGIRIHEFTAKLEENARRTTWEKIEMAAKANN
uniref:serine/threonine protein phosphatase 2A 57 kDa regulatory subunit B' beta isoform-like n=1 Tax=Erigeron canadensis TaxID=72917 RepID=UPI001CB978E2|nr:serine/threonine protein phosphatase 2A 57 kDa regulatory subunit B' beta isoform-like [Erigeron canadensis]